MHQAQTCLYSDIKIDKLAQLRKFYDTIKHSSHLGKEVKVLKVAIFMEEAPKRTNKASRLELFKIVTSLLSTYLPNLVEFKSDTQLAYMPVLHALLDSRLKKLKILGMPWEFMFETGEITNYATCALLLKDRLENLFISDSLESTKAQPQEQIFFDRLYDKLDEFEKLTEIKIHMVTADEIQEVEYVLENCKSLNKIEYEFKPRNDDVDHLSLNAGVTIDAISSFTPRPNIDSLRAEMVMGKDYKNLLYIMHKFPQLREIHLTIESIGLVSKLNKQRLSQFLNYLSKIDKVKVYHIATDHEAMMESIGSLWRATYMPGQAEVDLSYSSAYHNVMINFSKAKGAGTNETEIIYPSPQNTEWKHMDFVEQNGVFFESLVLSSSKNSMGYNERNEPPENIVSHILVHCPNLQLLFLENWILRRPNTPLELDNIKATYLEALKFYRCKVEYGVFQDLSRFIRKIDRLSFTEVENADGERPDHESSGNEILRIEIPDIEVKLIKLDYNCPDDDPIYVQMYTNNKTCCYYRYDSSQVNHCKKLSKREYLAVGHHRFVYIRCKSKPLVEYELYEDEDEDD